MSFEKQINELSNGAKINQFSRIYLVLLHAKFGFKIILIHTEKQNINCHQYF